MPKGLAKDLIHLLGRRMVAWHPEDVNSYASDATHTFAPRKEPDAVVLPETAKDVSRVLAYASEHGVFVTPRGAGSGLSGGSTPIRGGLVVDTKRMNHILEINKGNMTASVECGVVTAKLHNAVEPLGLFYPPDPQSMSVCTLGGNVATRAGGPRGVKYGTTGHYVLGLEVVLPDGSIITPGGVCVKNSVGYDLTHLFTGSEGTLGIITKVNLRLLPLPPSHATAVVACQTVEQAARIVSEIIASGTVPAMLEFISQMAALVMNAVISPPLALDSEAYLLMDMDGTPEQVRADAARLLGLCRDMGAKDVRVVTDEKEAKTYWDARAALFPSILTMAKKVITEDVTVPRDKIPEFVRAIQALSAETGMLIGIAGHAGDGNMHPSILFGEINADQEKKAQEAITKIIATGLSLGGTISGEHGVGLHKSGFLHWQLGPTQIRVMKSIKAAIDPKGIMNPGKIWPDGGNAA